MLIETGKFTREALAGKVAVVTGAGGGIGYEACRSLIWLGARTVVAEINKKNGQESVRKLNEEFGPDSALFVQTDVGDEKSIRKLSVEAARHYGQVDIVINNATIAALGAVEDVPIETWDESYRVNLRGPVLLARAFVPAMVERKSGVFVCVSSLGTAFMGPYEAMKAAQVHLGTTLDAELENSGVYAFTIGPGFVPTETALSAVPKLAGMMGIPMDELRVILKQQTISVEAAGAGFAAAVALAGQFHGQETASVAALVAAGIDLPKDGDAVQVAYTNDECDQILAMTGKVLAVLKEQTGGWKQRSVFEQQWLVRSFKKYAGMTVEEWLETLERLQAAAQAHSGDGIGAVRAPVRALAEYHAYMYEMGKGFIKDPAEREKNLAIVRGWQADAEELEKLLKK
ncbi:MAG TPA: SDR family NAD(P)-dependent oxidoreductase [Anaerolineales bacterium]|nr:SDR family NAD(P)-dependent oxidoreductase [Anaerolineales bacterium]